MTDLEGRVSLRASAGPRWMDCPRFADDREKRRTNGESTDVETVAMRFGTMVHANVLGGEDKPPRGIVFDRHTQTSKFLQEQVEYTSNRFRALMPEFFPDGFEDTEVEARKVFRHNGVEVELQGRADFLYRRDGMRGIGDLKTGQSMLHIHGSWYQLALYALLWPDVQECALVHLPRAQYGNVMSCRPQFQRAVSLRPLGWEVIRRVASAWDQEPAPNPMSIRCNTCPVTACEFNRGATVTGRAQDG